ncbi:28571_t:CDS:2 [Gigaspora margarita]|uniref:28571_t:CDS:1 n=1 Tax=Gigaspora margarita TaxID=4874 RepID=A0ABN7VYP5_GIGMA|nr:28571_t:CDS:2 [Gigaspora margarita]
MYEILVADKKRVDAIFDEFFISDKVGALEDWCNAGETTNIAELVHADANREGVQMKKQLDERRLATCECQDKYNIPNTSHSSESKSQKRKKYDSALPNKKTSQTSKTTIKSNKELDELDIEIAKKEKLRKLKLIEYEFQHKKKILNIDKQTKLAALHVQKLANIKKERELDIKK